MPSSYSSILRLEKQATGENQGDWGTNLNTVIDLIEAAIVGSTTINSTGGTTTLSTNNSSADQARCMAILATGTLVSNAIFVVPNASKLYIIRNGMTLGAFSLTVKTSSGSAITIPSGETVAVYVDGANICKKITKTAFTELLDVPTAYSSQALKLLRVNAGETALEFVTPAAQDPEFDSGTALLFPQAAAHSGWTQDTSVNDRMIRVTSGSGGGTGGSWTISGLSVGSTTLSTSQIPSHSHTEEGVTSSSTAEAGPSRDIFQNDISQSTGSTGSGSSHNHSISADAAWRPSYYNIIRATKD